MIESIVYYPAQTSSNLYKVPKDKWKSWNKEARTIFNHLYGTSVENKPVVASTDIFGEDVQTRKVLNAALWNVSWTAAEYINEKQ